MLYRDWHACPVKTGPVSRKGEVAPTCRTPMKLFIVRHGQTESNRLKVYAGQSDEPLEDEGISQAHVVGQQLSAEKVSAVYASPLRRARQTAEIIVHYFHECVSLRPKARPVAGGPEGGDTGVSARKDLKVKTLDGLREMVFGPWEGLREDEIARRYPDQWQVWLSKPAELELPGRETLMALQRRAVRAIDTITDETKQDAIVVTHVALIRCVFLHYNGIELDRYKTIDVLNGSIFQLKVDHGQGRMEVFRSPTMP